MTDVYTPKQRELLRTWQRGKLKRINILEGSVRSGKTWISLVLWAFWVATMPRGGNYLMVAKTLTSLRRNCLDLLQDLVGARYFSYSLSKKEGHLFGRLIYLEGVNDARSESKIRGMTLQGAYCDELTLFTEDFFSMLLSRLSCAGAKLVATTNPDNPYHWLKENYINRAGEIDLFSKRFLIEDNTFLDPEYVRNLEAEYTGVFYDRFILGLWVVAQGLIYPMFSDAENVYDDVDRPPQLVSYAKRLCGIDSGIENPTVYLDCYWDGETLWVDREYYHFGKKDRDKKAESDYADDFEKFFSDRPLLSTIVIDPAAAGLKAELAKRGYITNDADNSVVPGIQLVATMFKKRKIRVHKRCTSFIKELHTYAWDDKSCAHGDERPIKQADHACDALRYLVFTIISKYV